jgi:putative ABC transport system substrate-binding protein
MRTFAKELVDLQSDVILSQTTPVTAALHRETRTIPIIFVMVADPVGAGFAASVPRPGGNLTGFMLWEPSVAGKWLELLHRYRAWRQAGLNHVQSRHRSVYQIIPALIRGSGSIL